MDNNRRGRLRSHYQNILSGNKSITNTRDAKLFLEAICDQPDPVVCIENLISSPKGSDALQAAISADVTVEFLNASAADFIRYIQAPELSVVCGGDLLQIVVSRLVEPPIFWRALVKAQQLSRLSDHSILCFAWLLLYLISLPPGKAETYYDIAQSPMVQKAFSQSLDTQVRTLGEKIKHVISIVGNQGQLEMENGPGGRHDNDFANFRKIVLLPTAAELASKAEPFLLRAAEVDDCDQSIKLSEHIANQFRLCREDMLRDLKDEIQIAMGQKTGRRKGFLVADLKMDGVMCDEKSPWTLRLECTKDLPGLPKSSHDERRKFLIDNRQFFAHESLACLIADGQISALATIRRDNDLLAYNPPVFCLALTGGAESMTQTLLQLKLATQIQMVQLNTAIFSYEPILKQLQRTTRLALGDEIMLCEKGISVQPPPAISQFVTELVENPTRDLKTALSLPNSTILDHSQTRCLIAGFTERVSVIQGPPGTGKTYIGALLVKAQFVYTNKKILIVCYTNHALDQFLEDLQKVGIPDDEMVRLGSYHKATAATKPLVLSEQKSKFKFTRSDWNVINLRESEAASEAQQLLQAAATSLGATGVTKDELMEHIEFDFPEFYDAFVLPSQDDGMQKIGKKGKTISKYYLLDRWGNGMDSGVYPEVAHDFPEIWQMPSLERRGMLRKWRQNILREGIAKIYPSGQRYNDTLTQLNNLRYRESERRIIHEKRIIACTTTAAAKYVQIIQSSNPDILMVEEAGEIQESHILTALGPDTEQMILIGDHKRLRPKVHYDLSVEKGEGYDLNRSMFERLILQGHPHTALSTQHRMRPEISSLVRGLTYPDLVDDPKTEHHPNMRGFQDNVVFLNHNHAEAEMQDHPDWKDQNSTSSKRNSFEAIMTLKCVKYLGQQGYGTDKIVVLTPYLGQLRLLVDVLGEENDPVLNDLDSYDLVRAGLMPAATAKMNQKRLRISSIDNYQGEESDIVVVSLTRSNSRHDIGFMSAPERLNVLLSRARNGLIMIGDAETFQTAHKGKEVWGKLFDLLGKGKHIYDGFPVKCEQHPHRTAVLSSPQDFALCPEGGCNEPCTTILNCGLHVCPSRCHQLYDHSKIECKQPLRDKCPVGHQLLWLCHASKPSSCSKCDKENKAKEKALEREYERQKKRDEEERIHAVEIARIDEDIRLLREAMADARRDEELSQALRQRHKDLEEAKKMKEAALLRYGQTQSMRLNTLSPSSLSSNENQGISSPSKISQPDATVSPSEMNSGSRAANLTPAIKVPVVTSDRAVTFEPSASQKNWDRQKLLEGASNDAIDSLMAMTGLEDVKSQVLKIKARVETTQRQGTDLKRERFGLVLLGNPGTGKTTVARLYAKLLTSMGVLPGTEFVETTGSRLANEGVNGTKAHIDRILNAGGGAFFLDEAYQLASGNNFGGTSVLDFLLTEIENRVGTIVFIVAGYNKQMEQFFQHNPGFESRMPYRIQFADYDNKELLHMFGQLVQKKYSGRMEVEGGVAGLFARIVISRLGRGRSKEGFGNARALENVFAKIAERQADRIHQQRVAGLLPDDFFISMQDLIGPEPSEALISSKSWQELHNLIGLRAVKDSIQALLDRLQTNYHRELREQSPIQASLNRVFLGSPGTGKTSVGKLYGQILADIGLLSNGEVLIKNPSDFIGSHLGESEKKTRDILKTAEGKILIIDEAYMLYSGSESGGNNSDIYRSAVIDTIVAEVQSTPGEDRCVLLLGYKEQLEVMFQNVNPGLSRRFPLDDAFHFEDFDDDQLRQILDLKLKIQVLDATKEAKDVAIAMLGRARQRPNFGNAGEVENMISHAKSAYQLRESKKPVQKRADDIIFEPQDFDENFNRGADAVANCRELFKDVVGCEDVVSKLEGYIKAASVMKINGTDPRDYIPFNFIFKGPPGTGKTTTARKIGQVFYDMGFLSSVDVEECSATDLIGQYVGHTGPKTVKILEKALGKVLFIDEAYRLGEGHFAKDAIDELVDSLTKPRFFGKIIVVLAGYEDNMNQLLRVNPGLSSRFPEEVIFKNMDPEDCFELLRRKLQAGKIMIEQSDKDQSSPEILSLFRELSALPSWGNGRDIETLSKSLIRNSFQSGVNNITFRNIVATLKALLEQRMAREFGKASPALCQPKDQELPYQEASAPREWTQPSLSTQTTPNTETQIAKIETEPAVPSKSKIGTSTDIRDPGVSDQVWLLLEAAKAAEIHAQVLARNEVTVVQQMAKTLELREKDDALEVDQLTIKLANEDKRTTEIKRVHEEAWLKHIVTMRNQDEASGICAKEEAEASLREKIEHEKAVEELKRRHEEARLKHIATLRAKEEAEALLKEKFEKDKQRKREEARVQQKLRDMGVCVMGFRWIKQDSGYRCSAGGHFVSNEALGV